MDLGKKIENDLIIAQKAKNTLLVGTLRFLRAEIHDEAASKKRFLKDDEIMVIIRRQIKKRQEAVAAFRQGQRNDLAEKEAKEAAFLSNYLPRQIGSEKLEILVKEAIKKTQAVGLKDFGQVMGLVMKEVKGQADGQTVSAMVKKHLNT